MEFILFLVTLFFVHTLIKVIYDYYRNYQEEQRIAAIDQAEHNKKLQIQTERLHQKEMQERLLAKYKIEKIRNVENEARKRIQWFKYHSLQGGIILNGHEYNGNEFKKMSSTITQMVGYPGSDELNNFISSYDLAVTAIQEIQNTNKILDSSFPDYNRIFEKLEPKKITPYSDQALLITHVIGENEFAFTNVFISLMRTIIMNYRFLNTTNLDETKKVKLNISYILYQSYKEKSLTSGVIEAVNHTVSEVIKYQKNDHRSYFLGLVNGYLQIDFNLKLSKTATDPLPYPNMQFDEAEMNDLIENTLGEHKINVSPSFASYVKVNT